MLEWSLSSFIMQLDVSGWVAAGTIALVVVTGILAYITYLYMKETKRTREVTENILKAGQRPIFALEPEHYIGRMNQAHSDNFTTLNLVNHGATATDITVTCHWLESEIGSGSNQTFYILSLSKHGYAGLDIPVKDIVSQRKFIKVEITCRDAAGEPFSKTITNGLDKIKGTQTKIAYQNNVWFTIYDAIDRIGQKLDSLR
jgi:hypothetical protein